MSPHAQSSDNLQQGLLSSPLVGRLQSLGTRLRALGALLAALVIFYFADRGPMWPGLLLVLGGESVQLWATAHLRKNLLLVKSGPYGWLRNPMYFGRFFVGLGLTLITWRFFLLLPYLILYPLYAQARVLQEERRLHSLFPDEYFEYCSQVNRWLPRPPAAPLSPNRWAWSAIFQNHELRVAGAVGVFLILLRMRLTAL